MLTKVVTDVGELKAFLLSIPNDVTIGAVTYSEDLESGELDITYDERDNKLYLVGSADDV